MDPAPFLPPAGRLNLFGGDESDCPPREEDPSEGRFGTHLFVTHFAKGWFVLSLLGVLSGAAFFARDAPVVGIEDSIFLRRAASRVTSAAPAPSRTAAPRARGDGARAERGARRARDERERQRARGAEADPHAHRHHLQHDNYDHPTTASCLRVHTSHVQLLLP